MLAIVMVSRKRLTYLKITWRIIGTLDTMILSWLITANWKWGILIGGVELVTKWFFIISTKMDISSKFSNYGVNKTIHQK